MREDLSSSQEEPFLLTILPFVGLGVLLVLAVVWRLIPGAAGEAGEAGEAGGTATPEVLAANVIASWEQAPERNIPIEPGRDFTIGPEDARVTLVEFSDFECPYCRTAANGVHDVLDDYEGDVRLVFKNFPLDTACNETMAEPLHHLACQAASLAWCAGQQDHPLFWETHDALYREPMLTPETMARISRSLDIDADALTACVNSDAALAAIKEDIALGRSLGIRGTPIFFANGRRVSDYRRAALDAVVEHILSR
jgi:protein-disulfide isomerase